MRSLTRLGAAALVLALATPSLAKELWERAWIEVRTPNFTVASCMNERDSVRVASELESFRIAVSRLLNVRVEESVPTRVFLIPRRTRALGIGADQIGWFRPEMRQNTAVVSEAGGGMSLAVVMFHEYAHFLAHNRPGAAYPAWFDEGFAEVLASMTFKDGHAFVGDLIRSRREWLQYAPWIEFSRVLRTRDPAELSVEDRAMFYAQSWALVHYLLLGPHREKFGSEMAAFLAAVEHGQSDVEAFEATFGEKPRGLRRRLLKYLTGEAKIWPVPLPPEQAAVPQVRALPQDEIAARIGVVELVGGELKSAQQAFDAALAANPNNAAALTGAADLHKFAGRFEQAEPLYTRALAQEPNTPYVLLDYAEYFLDRARAIAESDPAQAAEWVIEARRQFARSYKLNPNVPETLAMNGASYLGDPEGAQRAIESLEAAESMLPSQPQIRFLLAQAYAQAERSADALRVVRSLVAWGHAGGSEEAAALLRELEAELARMSEVAAPDSAASQTDANTP